MNGCGTAVGLVTGGVFALTSSMISEIGRYTSVGRILKYRSTLCVAVVSLTASFRSSDSFS